MVSGPAPNTSLTLLQNIDPSGGFKACWIWLGFKNPKGYGQLSRNNKTCLAHRWSYEHHHNIVIPKGISVLHSCDNPCCCNPMHLFLGTNQDNVNDKMQKGRFRPRTTNFTQNDFDKMKQMRQEGMTHRQIAIAFGCDRTTVAYWECREFLKSNKKTS